MFLVFHRTRTAAKPQVVGRLGGRVFEQTTAKGGEVEGGLRLTDQGTDYKVQVDHFGSLVSWVNLSF